MDQRTTKFMEILTALCGDARANARNGVEQILNVSANFIGKEDHGKLVEFYNMYFGGSAQIEATKERMNRDVDDLIDQINSGQVPDSCEIPEKSEQETERLGLSALQKQLETMIALEENIKTKLKPVLSSMQFEDAVSQRLDHILRGFTMLTTDMGTDPLTAEEIGQTLATFMSSKRERELFYKIVLRQPAPEGVEDEGIWLDLAA